MGEQQFPILCDFYWDWIQSYPRFVLYMILYKVHKFCFFDSKCFSFRIWKVEEYRIFAIICAVGRVIVTNFINHWLIVQWWLWGTNSRGSKLKIIFLCYFVRRKNEVCPYFLEHCLVFQYFMITIKKSCPLINLL